jgi:hypothetical protein
MLIFQADVFFDEREASGKPVFHAPLGHDRFPLVFPCLKDNRSCDRRHVPMIIVSDLPQEVPGHCRVAQEAIAE